MPNLMEKADVKVFCFGYLPIGERFLTFSSGRAIVWVKLKNDFIGPGLAVRIFDGFLESISSDTEVILIWEG